MTLHVSDEIFRPVEDVTAFTEVRHARGPQIAAGVVARLFGRLDAEPL